MKLFKLFIFGLFLIVSCKDNQKPKDLIEFEWEKEEKHEELKRIKTIDFDTVFPKTMKA